MPEDESTTEPGKNAISELSRLQAEQGCLSEEAVRETAEKLGLPLHHVHGVASFYPSYRLSPPAKTVVSVCRDLSCWLAKADPGLREALSGNPDIEVNEVSCLGRCDIAPAALINGLPVCIADLAQAVAWAEAPDTIAAQDGGDTSTSNEVDPYSSEDERYGAVRAFVQGGREPEEIIRAMKESGLRGRGGAGFPTGLKWELVRAETEGPKYVVCNADECEPGTFKDRQILEELPHLVLEGMILAAWVTGAETGYLYIRHEYEREMAAVEVALQDARSRGILGERILDTESSFDVSVFVSPGGYIQGEESALIEALEGRRGESRNKPPFPGHAGLHGKPTVVNNVETLAMTPCIVLNGAEWWKGQGRGDFRGLKYVSVSGDVRKPGVYLVPMGTTMNELIEMAGDTKSGAAPKAVLPGGVSSNVLGAEAFDTPLDFEALAKAGSMLGSGGVVVIGDDADLLEAGLNITRFFQRESCGKCVPCRVGLRKAERLLEDVVAGRASAEALDALRELHDVMARTSVCGLGQAGLGPIVSILEGFPDELAARLDPAGGEG